LAHWRRGDLTIIGHILTAHAQKRLQLLADGVFRQLLASTAHTSLRDCAAK